MVRKLLHYAECVAMFELKSNNNKVAPDADSTAELAAIYDSAKKVSENVTEPGTKVLYDALLNHIQERINLYMMRYGGNFEYVFDPTIPGWKDAKLVGALWTVYTTVVNYIICNKHYKVGNYMVNHVRIFADSDNLDRVTTYFNAGTIEEPIALFKCGAAYIDGKWCIDVRPTQMILQYETLLMNKGRDVANGYRTIVLP